ncbi:hypothetical protein E6O75_ATG00160 [Venturia nashicola]|uniref:Uncharacterized protein n=1 Tax=Venturia nashicola TaxID=86259 RepID=A0A4Z1PEM5_9PEZI|nr:hypothetical protein E6O75_ATG00160 [Venturia nashicola]
MADMSNKDPNVLPPEEDHEMREKTEGAPTSNPDYIDEHGDYRCPACGDYWKISVEGLKEAGRKLNECYRNDGGDHDLVKV